MKDSFEARWGEMLMHVEKEKERYQSLVVDIGRMMKEHERMVTIARSIEPFVVSLSAVSVQINPR